MVDRFRACYARILRMAHCPRTHYTVIACISLMLMHEGGKTADYLFILLAIICEKD